MAPAPGGRRLYAGQVPPFGQVSGSLLQDGPARRVIGVPAQATRRPVPVAARRAACFAPLEMIEHIFTRKRAIYCVVLLLAALRHLDMVRTLPCHRQQEASCGLEIVLICGLLALLPCTAGGVIRRRTLRSTGGANWF